jgi:predicted  nucleic acid-binding Zn-ribbon protein
MPNKCIHCSEVYPDGARQALEGCSKCGSRFFFFISNEKYKKILASKVEVQTKIETTPQTAQIETLNLVEELSTEDKKHMEEDVREIMGIEDIEAPVILDLETVKVTSPGKYLLDIPNLFSKERPLVYKLEDGKYVIDLEASITKKK